MAPADAVRLIRTGKSVLEGWHNTYMQVREKIEVSGRDARWEFSKPMLFERTNYMAEICSDLSEMVEIVDDFHKFLGPELKAVTGDSQVISLLHLQLPLELVLDLDNQSLPCQTLVMGTALISLFPPCFVTDI